MTGKIIPCPGLTEVIVIQNCGQPGFFIRSAFDTLVYYFKFRFSNFIFALRSDNYQHKPNP